ncbi:hypothetical protein [Streptomyces sp. NBC_01304]|uniref:hypothetical protein n=1 Tax=Streptomyces sp. NBC_01304 TaxID=2903818 RepID=UPI002E107346|nr:hypothetical protein OG430_25695 [Streptomyces sp. NBC_01304]
MAQNPHAPQGPEGQHDPAGSTQMFRAFVDEGSSPQAATAERKSSKKALYITLGVVAVLVFAFLSLPNQPWTIF